MSRLMGTSKMSTGTIHAKNIPLRGIALATAMTSTIFAAEKKSSRSAPTALAASRHHAVLQGKDRP